ncbi:unnamed protein product, partial [Effrenium voratum]
LAAAPLLVVASARCCGMADWVLDVESVYHEKTSTEKRDGVLSFLSAALLLRRYAGARRATSRAAGKRQSAAAYQRWPKGPKRLLNKKFELRYRLERRLLTRVVAPEEVLRAMKVNVEQTDTCTLLAHKILSACRTREDLAMKAYVIVRTYSAASLRLKAWGTPWVSVEAGARALLKEADHPADLFTAAFNPNRRLRNEALQARSPRKFVQSVFASCSGKVAPVTWQWVYSSRENVYTQLLRLPGLGPLDVKNLFQLLKRHDTLAQWSPPGNARAGRQGVMLLC